MGLQNLDTDANIKTETDSVGGSFILESALYTMTIEVAYLSKSRRGAQALNVHLKNDKNEQLQAAIYVTSGDAKGNKNTYVDKKGDKQYLPGYITANSISLLTIGKNIGDLPTQEKVINLYNYDEKKELPTKVEMFIDLLGAEAIFGIQKQIVDKNIKNDNGDYVPSGETREINEITKVFRKKDGLTVAEITVEADEAVFINTWDTRFTGETKDRSSGKSGVTAGAPASSRVAKVTPTKSLFNADK